MFVMAFIQVPRIINKGQYKMLLVYGMLWCMAGLYGSLVILRVPLPNPTDMIKRVYEIVGLLG